MTRSTRPPTRAALLALTLLLTMVIPGSRLAAQVPAEAVMHGRVDRGDTLLTDGWVILHHITEEEQGPLDSTRVGGDGTFSLRLPRVPDPARSEVFVAAVRHDGILYFGEPVALAVQLDSTYVIQVHDTVMVSGDRGRVLPVEIRNIFLEEEEGRWQVTDVFLVHHDGPGTLVTDSLAGAVWRHRLPQGAEEPTLGEGDVVPGAAAFEDGDLVIRSSLPPGERMFVIRYFLPEPFAAFPMDGPTETIDVLLKEPAPAVVVPGLQQVQSMELSGATYRRYTGVDLAAGELRITAGELPRRPPLKWISVVLALLLTSAGLWAALRTGPTATVAEVEAGTHLDRLVLEIARLDEDFEALSVPSADARQAYTARRRALLEQLRAGA